MNCLFKYITLAAVLILCGCTEIQLGANTAKGLWGGGNGGGGTRGDGASEGAFKVGNPYKVEGTWYYPHEQYDLVETGLASWYGPGFDGHRTASGEIYHSDELTAAHRTLQMPSLVRVTNLDNGRSIIVRVNDRGPYKRGRVMDVSSKAADLLGMKGAGTAKIKLQVLSAESMRIAQLAKTGAQTRGYEVAMNNNPHGLNRAVLTDVGINNPDSINYGAAPTGAISSAQEFSYQTASIGSVSRENLSAPGPVPGHVTQGTFYPDPVVTHEPVTATGIYVQAGSFTVRANAERLRQNLQLYKSAKVEEATINGRTFYRVRLGPVSGVPQADELLSRMLRGGHSQAIIVVE